jgi:hypothetical protein
MKIKVKTKSILYCERCEDEVYTCSECGNKKKTEA